MRLLAGTVGLILLATHPATTSAQAVSYPDSPPTTGAAAPAAYQQPENPSAPLPLAPLTPKNRAESDKRPGGLPTAVTVGGSLAVVLGIFFSIVWVLRRASPGITAILPTEAFEVLGRAPLANRQQVHLLRCGSKLLLVAVNAAGSSAGAGAETLTEITDPAEVDRLAGLCRPTQSSSPASSFRQWFRPAEDRHA